MKFLQITILLLLSIQMFSQSNDSKFASQLLKEMKTESKAVGVSAGVSRNGEVIWKDSNGFSDCKQKTPFSYTTKTRIASIAKPMTAVGIMQLKEKDSLGLDDLISKYLDDCPTNWEKITVRQLLSHTSGIKGYLNSDEAESNVQYESLNEAMDVFKTRELSFSPGTGFLYTSYGYVVLGVIIEEVTGLAYEDYMLKNIWEVADMKNTYIENSDINITHSILYHKKNRRSPKKAKKNNLSNRLPAGGIISTLEDLLKFGHALNEGKLISNESFELMTQNQFEEKEGNPYGLGWFFYGQKDYENAIIGHSGEQTGASTQIMILPKKKTVVVVVSNTSGVWKDVVNLSGALIGFSEQTN